MTFIQMLKTVRSELGVSQQGFAAAIGISAQYLCDIEQGKRLPTVKLTNDICDHLSRGPLGRRAWHIAAAQAHGWEVAGDELEALQSAVHKILLPQNDGKYPHYLNASEKTAFERAIREG